MDGANANSFVFLLSQIQYTKKTKTFFSSYLLVNEEYVTQLGISINCVCKDVVSFFVYMPGFISETIKSIAKVSEMVNET